MKKVIISFIAGALIMSSGQVLADTISKVGKKITSEATVYLNEKQLSDAIIVDGKSYAPVRDIAESFKAKVGFEGATNERKAVIKLITTDGSEMPIEHQLYILNTEKQRLEEERSRRQGGIENLNRIIAEKQRQLETTQAEMLKNRLIAQIENNKEAIKESQEYIDDLTKQIEEIDAQIAELKNKQ